MDVNVAQLYGVPPNDQEKTMWNVIALIVAMVLGGCKKTPASSDGAQPLAQAVKIQSDANALPLAAEKGARLFTLSHLNLSLISEQILLPVLLLGDPGKTPDMTRTVDVSHSQVSDNVRKTPILDTFHKVSESKRHGASMSFTLDQTIQGSQLLHLDIGSSSASVTQTKSLRSSKGTEESYLHTARLEATYNQTGSDTAYKVQLDAKVAHTLLRNQVQEVFTSIITTPTLLSVAVSQGAYTVQSGVLQQTTDHQETLITTFSQLHYPSLSACQPDGGTVTGQFTDDQGQTRTFSAVFSGDADSILTFEDGEKSQLELPFRCR